MHLHLRLQLHLHLPLHLHLHLHLQGAPSWLQDTSCSLDMFLDPDRSLYCGFGLRRSVTKVLLHHAT